MLFRSAKVNSSCGLHIHVDAANHNRQSLKNLLSIMYAKEDILFKALQVNEARAARWCQKVREPMLRQARTLSAEETKDLTQLESIWYEGDVSAGEHYNWTRYYALNLHSVFYRGTVAVSYTHLYAANQERQKVETLKKALASFCPALDSTEQLRRFYDTIAPDFDASPPPHIP